MNGLPCSSLMTEAVRVDQHLHRASVYTCYAYLVTYQYLQRLKLAKAAGRLQDLKRNVLMAMMAADTVVRDRTNYLKGFER